jgi:hypothetical protein
VSSELLLRVFRTVILSSLLVFPATARSTELETTIDLNYTYDQSHLGDRITGSTKVQQKYEVAYTSALTSIFDLLLLVSLDIENGAADDAAETSRLAPSIEIKVEGPRALMVLTYDTTRSRTEQYRGTSERETFDNNYKAEFEVVPDYLPAVKLTFERGRQYEEMTREAVDKTFQLEVSKEHKDFKFDFLYEHKNTYSFPVETTNESTLWSAQAAYQSTVWWDVDVDLTYEIEGTYSEDFERDVFTDEEKEYTQEVQFKLSKSLNLLPRLQADLRYEYEFEQDLLLQEFDYAVSQDMGLAFDYRLMRWLEVGAEFTREMESEYDVPPKDKIQSLTDKARFVFAADPLRWLRFSGSSKWEFQKDMDADSGATVAKVDSAVHELSMRHNWGKWWDLKVTGGSEREYTDDWVTKKKASVKAELQLLFYDFAIEPSYELERVVEYEAFEPLAFEQARKEEFILKLDYAYDFPRFIETGFTYGITLSREEKVDEVLNFEEVVGLSEETKIQIALVDIVRDMELKGEVTRKATDTEHDDEPMLVNIAYALTLDWEINDIQLGLTYKYDDNGDSFDQSSINTKVAWQYENMDVSGEYQFDKTYAYEIDEQRKFNLKMNVLF